MNEINASFQQGQVVSLIGPNGSGKTTLIKSILGLVKPDSGKIIFNGKIVTDNPDYRKQIGYMPQIGRYPDNMKIGQLFTMLKNMRSESKTDEDLIDLFNLRAIFDKPMRTLSGGTRQKVSAAIAFLFDPEVLILDEPTAGLDPLSSEILKEKIIQARNRNKLVLITSHVLSDLDDLTTHVMYMQEGKIQFYKDLATIQDETGETRLGKAIAEIMRGAKLKALWSDDSFEVQRRYKALKK